MKKKMLSLLLALGMLLAAMPALATAPEDPTLTDGLSVDDSTAATDTFGPFEAEILNGEGGTLTEEAFEEPVITLINFWATWCGPCIQELPDLAKVSEMTGGKVQVVGVLLDALGRTGQRDDSVVLVMKALLDSAQATYPVILPDEYLVLRSSDMQFVPTTMIVDNQGIVHRTEVGTKTAEEWIAVAQEVADSAYEEQISLMD